MTDRSQRQNFDGWYGRAGGPRTQGTIILPSGTLGHGLEGVGMLLSSLLGISRAYLWPLAYPTAEKVGQMLFGESVTNECSPSSFSDPCLDKCLCFCARDTHKGAKGSLTPERKPQGHE